MMCRRQFFRVFLMLLAAFSIVSANAQNGPAEITPLSPPQPIESDGKQEVLEFFAYGCIHCANLEPRLAEWIARQTREQFKESATQLIDFYHVSEYLAAASETLPECRRKQWRKLQQRRLLRGDAPKVIKALRLHSEAEALAQEQAPMRHALQYMEKRAGCFDYPKAQKEGLPIGSGLIEGGHRHVLQKRLKISGAWWLRQNAAAMAALSVVMENNDWLSYWKSVA